MIVRCLHCGEDRLIDAMKSPSGQIAHVVCRVCAKVSFLTEHRVQTCPVCKGVGSHEDGCLADAQWAV